MYSIWANLDHTRCCTVGSQFVKQPKDYYCKVETLSFYFRHVKCDLNKGQWKKHRKHLHFLPALRNYLIQPKAEATLPGAIWCQKVPNKHTWCLWKAQNFSSLIGFYTFRPKHALLVVSQITSWSYRVTYHVTLVGLFDDVKPHLLQFLHHAAAAGIVWDYLTESSIVPGPRLFGPISKGFLGLLRYCCSLLPTAPLQAHPSQVYWKVFLRLEALRTVNNVALRNPEG